MSEKFADREESKSLNREELLQLAIQTAEENPQGARVMFQQILNEDPRNERALLWMAYLSKKREERRKYLNRVLKVNPRSRTARKEIERLNQMEKARQRRTLFTGIFLIVIAILLVVLAILAGTTLL